MSGSWKARYEKLKEKTFVSTFEKPFINFVSDEEMMIENHMGIISYDAEEVVISTKKFYLKIHGSNMIIDYITREDVHLSGKFAAIEYDRM